MVVFTTFAMAQNKTVTGKVTDEKGAPVANASVVVKGTTKGVTTSVDGSFSISVPNTAKSLVVSSVNFISQDVSIKGNNVSVTLQANTASLDEVVVVGYQQINKRSVSGSVAKVSAKDIENRPVLSFDQALTGKAAGVQINTSSGLVGDNVIIRVRGAASISSGSQPLIILDGVQLTQGSQGQLYNPANALADLNPNDIESVEVLKDASAAAIYGSRGSAGVLLITTKKGKEGQPTVNYDLYAGFNENSRKLNVLNAEQYNTTINKMRSNAGLSNIAAYGDINGTGTPLVVSTDWQNEVFRKGFTQNHQVSVSGGNGKTTYYASLNYNDYENFIKVNRQSRGSARLNLTTKVGTWGEVGINTQFSRTKSYGLGSGVGGALSGIPFGPLTALPNIPVYTATGDFYLFSGGNGIALNVPNPVAVQALNQDNRDAPRYLGSLYGQVQIIKGLKFKTQISVDYSTGFTDQYWNSRVGDGQGSGGIAQTVYNERKTWTYTNTLNYIKKIGNHELNLLAGSEYNRRTSYYSYVAGITQNDPAFRLITTSNYQTVQADNGIDGLDDGLASYFGGLNYSFKNKYIATANFRADSYSGFGRDNRYGYFPSAAIAWRVSEESFMKNVRQIKDLKVRASYGVTGNSNIGYYPSLSTYASAQYADLSGLNLSSPGNSALKWERTEQLDFGVDATIFKGVNVSIDYYKKKTADLILSNPVLATIGFPGNTITQNIGKLENSGIEFSLNADILKRKNLVWNVNFNFAYSKNKVVATNSNGDPIFGGAGLAKPGVDLGTYFLINWAGVNTTNGLPQFTNINGDIVQYDQSVTVAANRWTTIKNGAVAPAIAATDRTVQEGKTPYPKYLGGLSQTVTFKNFDLGIDMQYAFGFYLYNQTKQTLLAYTNNRNKSTDILNAWSTPGQTTDVPRLFYNDNQWSQTSTRFLEKGDFVRVRNIQLGYTLPKSLISKIKLNKFRFYLQVQNAFTITGYSGVDPESNANGNTNIGLGVDNFRPYLARTFTAGFNIGL